jgi:hypothetical protein
MLLVYEAFSYLGGLQRSALDTACMRPGATSVCSLTDTSYLGGLELLVYAALRY